MNSDHWGHAETRTIQGPGHFLEVTKIISHLASKSSDQPSFHVVALFLPNFGFSQGSRKKGFSQQQYAEVCHKLMLILRYDEYGQSRNGRLQS
jgi:hypothetical protein